MTYNCRPRSKKGPSFPVKMEYIQNGWVSVATICNEKLFVTPQYVPNSEEFAISSDGYSLYFNWKPSDLYWTFTEVKVNDGPWQFWVPEDWGGDSPGSSEWESSLEYYGAVVGDTIRARMRLGDEWDFPNQFSKVYAVDSLIVPGVPDVENLTLTTGGSTVKVKWTPANYEILGQYKFNSDDWVDFDSIDGSEGIYFFNTSNNPGDTIQVRFKYVEDGYESNNWATSEVGTISLFTLFTGTTEPNFSDFINHLNLNTEFYIDLVGNNIITNNPSGISGMNLSGLPLEGSLNLSFCNNLEYLYCYNTNITSINASDCITLFELDCGNNSVLTSVILDNCRSLIYFGGYETSLTTIDLTGTNINYCDMNDSDLSSIIATDITGDGGKAYFDLWNCNLSTNAINTFFNSLGIAVDNDKSYIGIGDNPGSLSCNPELVVNKGWQVDGGPIRIFVGESTLVLNDFANGITSSGGETTIMLYNNNIYVNTVQHIVEIDLHNVSGLAGSLSVTGNSNVVLLDVHGLSGITQINIEGCGLTSLNLTGCSGLTYLNAYNNNISSINLAGCTSLTDINVSYNELTSISLPNTIHNLYAENNNLSTLDLSNKSELVYLHVGSNSNLSTLTLTGCINLTTLYCNNTILETLNLNGFDNLSYLNIAYINSLNSLTLTGCTALEQFYAVECNGITSLDLSTCNSLLAITFNNSTGITGFNLTGCTNLIEFYSQSCTQATSVNVSGCQHIEILYSNNCALTSVNVNNTPALRYVILSNNQLSNTTIDSIFTQFPSHSGAYATVNSNPGSGTCDASIAQNKGWTVQI